MMGLEYLVGATSKVYPALDYIPEMASREMFVKIILYSALCGNGLAAFPLSDLVTELKAGVSSGRYTH